MQMKDKRHPLVRLSGTQGRLYGLLIPLFLSAVNQVGRF